MPIDPYIASGIKLPQFNLPDYGADMAQMAQIQNARNQNALAQYQLGAAQRAEEESLGIKNYLTENAGKTPAELQSGLFKFGAPGIAIAKALNEQQNAQLTRQKTQQEIDKLKREFADQSFRNISLNPSDENIKAWAQDAIIQEFMTQEEANAKAQSLLSMSVPERQAYMASQGANSKELIALFESKPVKQTNGQEEWFVETNKRLPNFGQPITSKVQMQVTPGQQLTAAAGIAKPVVVGDKLIDPTTGKEIYVTPDKPAKPVVVGGRLVDPATGKEIYVTPDKPVVVGSALVDPATGKQIYQGPAAPTDLARLQAERDALIKANPKDPLIKEYNARINQITTHGPATSVSIVNTPTAKSLSEPVGKMAETSLVKAQGAADTMESANQIRAALNAGNVIAGPLAGARTKFAQILETAGIGDKEKLANTRNAIQGLASMTLASRADLKGQGQITDMETKLLERAKSADIGDLTIGELHQIVNTAQKVSNRLWSNHQTLLKTMGSDPEAASARKYYEPTGSIPEALGDQTSSKPSGKDNRQSLNDIFGRKKP